MKLARRKSQRLFCCSQKWHSDWVSFLSAGAAATLSQAAAAWTPEKTENCAPPTGMSGYFSKCAARPTPTAALSTSNAYCLPGSTGGTAIPNTLTVEKKAGNTYATLSIGVKNCRAPATGTSSVTGDFVIAIDNSSSACNLSNKGTDCSRGRLSFAKSLANELFGAGASKVGVVAFGGRQSLTTSPVTYTNDTTHQIDPDTQKKECSDKSARQAGTDPWETTSGGEYNSVCEYLALANSTSVSSMTTFIDDTGAIPRGSTDYTYMLEAIANNSMLGGSTKTSKHAILITDGLPTIPRRIPRAVCEVSNILMAPVSANGGKFYTESTSPNREYCYDRQFKKAVDAANAYIEGRVDFDGISSTVGNRYSGINLHNILYVTSGNAYAEADYSTRDTIYPDDVLMETSARTGSGKVKFSYIHGTGTDLASQENTFLESLKEAANTSAVQRVEAIVGGQTYQAVSSGAFDEAFEIKVPGLNAGTTTATINTYYADSTTPDTQTITIDVTSTNTYASTGCTDMSSALTIDGDSPTSTTPTGDGILPYTRSTGEMCRVYRNSSNYLRDSDSFYVQNFNETKREKAARLSIQGGTGNCGTIASSTGQSSFWQIFALAPLLFAGVFAAFATRKRKT